MLSISEQHANGLRRVQYVGQNGDHPLNRFGVERIVLDLPFANLFTTPVILEPSLGASAKSYTLGNAPDGADFGRSIAANLARGALDLYSKRTSSSGCTATWFSIRHARLGGAWQQRGKTSPAVASWGLGPVRQLV